MDGWKNPYVSVDVWNILNLYPSSSSQSLWIHSSLLRGVHFFFLLYIISIFFKIWRFLIILIKLHSITAFASIFHYSSPNFFFWILWIYSSLFYSLDIGFNLYIIYNLNLFFLNCICINLIFLVILFVFQFEILFLNSIF